MSADAVRGAALAAGIAASSAASAWLVGRAVSAVAGDRQQAWIVGRAAGLTSYVLLVAVVGLGLVLSHPWSLRMRHPSGPTRIRVHVSLAVLALAFLAMHVVVLATDRFAGVGWRGALLPMGAAYRPVPVTLGVIGAYAGILAGVTAALAGRVGARVWWPLHKVAAGTLLLVWLHAVRSGSDSRPLLALYVATGAAIAVLAVSRYAARTPADRRGDVVVARTAR